MYHPFETPSAKSKAIPWPTAPSREPAAPREIASRLTEHRWLLFVGLAAFAICMPFFHVVCSMEDEGVLLHGADRMLRGDRLYTDFFEFLPPGGFVLTAGWFSVAGVSLWSARALAVLTIVGIACFTYLASRRSSGNSPLAAGFTLGWLMMSQGLWTQLGHHWFTTLFSMASLWAALPSDRGRRSPLISGLAAGMAAMVTPTRGALAMLAALTAFLHVRRWRAGLAIYLLASAVVPTALLMFLVRTHAVAAAFHDVIQFPAVRYAPIQAVPFGSWANVQNYPFLFIFPAAVILTIAVYARNRLAHGGDQPLHPCAGFCVAGFVGCFPRPDVSHIAFAVPLACPLFAWSVTRLIEGWRPIWRHGLAACVLAFCSPTLIAYGWLANRAIGSRTTPSTRGEVALIQQPGASEMLTRIASLPAGDTFFFYPVMPTMPFLAARSHVSEYDIFTPGYTLPSQYHDACVSVMRRAAWIVIDRSWMDPSMWLRAFPAMRNAEPPEARSFENDLDRGFEFTARYGTFELRHRRPEIDDGDCANILE